MTVMIEHYNNKTIIDQKAHYPSNSDLNRLRLLLDDIDQLKRVNDPLLQNLSDYVKRNHPWFFGALITSHEDGKGFIDLPFLNLMESLGIDVWHSTTTNQVCCRIGQQVVAF